jgi:hypothetical protein
MHHQDLVTIRTTCPNCHRVTDITIEAGKLQAYQSGTHIQYVWPEWSPIQREQLITGMCSDECWNKYIGV